MDDAGPHSTIRGVKTWYGYTRPSICGDRARVNYKSRPTFIAWRFYLLLSIIVFAACGLCWRVFSLAILDQHFLKREGDERVLRYGAKPLPFAA